jgi:hypothetical protein
MDFAFDLLSDIVYPWVPKGFRDPESLHPILYAKQPHTTIFRCSELNLEVKVDVSDLVYTVVWAFVRNENLVTPMTDTSNWPFRIDEEPDPSGITKWIQARLKKTEV